MRIYQDLVTETEIISDGYKFNMLFEDSTAEIQSKLIAKGEVNVDVGCGNAFGGKNEDEEGEAQGGSAPVEKVNELIDAFGYQETSFGNKKEFQEYFKAFAKNLIVTLKDSPRLESFKKGAAQFVKFISQKFDDITFYTPKDFDATNSLIYSYWKNENDEAPVFLFFLDGMKSYKI